MEEVLSSYGEEENTETVTLRDMIRRATTQVRMPSTNERIKSYEEFLDRVSRRHQNVQNDAKTMSKEEIVDTEISQARDNLSRMRTEMDQDIPPVPNQSDIESELQSFERDQEVRETMSEGEFVALQHEGGNDENGQ